MNNSKLNYIDFIKNLPKNDDDYPYFVCPNCYLKGGMKYQYFGDNHLIGWKIIWCENCLFGINISRVQIPENSNVIFNNEDFLEFSRKNQIIIIY